MMALIVAVLKSQGAGYFALNLSGQVKDLEILELIPTGSQSQLIVKGPSEALKNFRRLLPSEDLESCIQIENWDLRIEKAFYSLEHAPIAKTLVFVENESLGRLFRAAEAALVAGALIVDLKIPRGSVKWGVLILTAEVVPVALLEELRNGGCVVNVVENPGPELQKFFDIEA